MEAKALAFLTGHCDNPNNSNDSLITLTTLMEATALAFLTGRSNNPDNTNNPNNPNDSLIILIIPITLMIA